MPKVKQLCRRRTRAEAWLKAVAEGFFHTLKVEFIHAQQYRTRLETRREILTTTKFFIIGHVAILLSA